MRGPDEVGEVEEPLGGGEVPGVGLLAPQTLCRSYKVTNYTQTRNNLRSRRCTFLSFISPRAFVKSSTAINIDIKSNIIWMKNNIFRSLSRVHNNVH